MKVPIYRDMIYIYIISLIIYMIHLYLLYIINPLQIKELCWIFFSTCL